MALIKPVNGIMPKFGKNFYAAENATIVGQVVMGDDCSVWFFVCRVDESFVAGANEG